MAHQPADEAAAPAEPGAGTDALADARPGPGAARRAGLASAAARAGGRAPDEARGAARSGSPAPLRSIEEMTVEAAWLYYYEDRTQSEIAERLGVSRSSVATYLQQARAIGLVEVRLEPGLFDTRIAAGKLATRYGLAEVLVAPGRDSSLSRVARLAARRLPDLLAPGDRLGVAWGQTIAELAENVLPRPVPGLDVVQLVGAMRTPYGFDSTICAARIAAAFSGRVVSLHAPAVLSNPVLAGALRAEEVIARQLEALTRIDKVIFAAGSVADDSHIVLAGVVTPKVLAEYRALGAVGVVCGRFIDAEGRHIDGPADACMIGILPGQIRGLGLGLLVSCGPGKARAIDAALKGGYASHLVTDLPTAEAMLALAPG